MPRKPLSRSWTADEIAQLATLLREGKSYDQIARRLRRTVLGVSRQVRKMAESEGRPDERG